MNAGRHYTFSEPRHPLLRWLIDPGPRASPEIRGALRGELFNSPMAILAAALNGLVLNGLALVLGNGLFFLSLILADFGLAGLRVSVAYRAIAASRRHTPAPTDLYFLAGILWYAVQGVMLLATAASDDPGLQAASAFSVAGLVSTNCARNYPAPRYAMLLSLMTALPFLVGICLARNYWLRALLIEGPLFFAACLAVVIRFQTLSVALMQARFESEHVARYDPLTRLLNRAGLAEYINALQLESGRRFVVFYLDLDGFKQVNDTHGHAAGDILLADVAERLRLGVRSSDVIARLGGDEFVILAPDLREHLAPDLAEAVIRRVSGTAYPQLDGQEAWIGLSVGYACYPEDGTTVKQLQLGADMALYEAKRAGRGRARRAASRPAAQAVA